MLYYQYGVSVGLAPPDRLGGIMVFADPYGEIEIPDEDFINDDFEGHLVAEAHRIATGDSADPPTVEMIQALIRELASARALWHAALARDGGDIPF